MVTVAINTLNHIKRFLKKVKTLISITHGDELGNRHPSIAESTNVYIIEWSTNWYALTSLELLEVQRHYSAYALQKNASIYAA